VLASTAIFHFRYRATSVAVWLVFAEYDRSFDSVHLGLQQHIRQHLDVDFAAYGGKWLGVGDSNFTQ